MSYFNQTFRSKRFRWLLQRS